MEARYGTHSESRAATSPGIPAPAAPATSGKAPFPAPRQAQVTDGTKCDFGTVLSLDAPSGRPRPIPASSPPPNR